MPFPDPVTGLRLSRAPAHPGDLIVAFASPTAATGAVVWHLVYLDGLLVARTRQTRLILPGIPGEQHTVQVLAVWKGDPEYDPTDDGLTIEPGLPDRPDLEWIGVGTPVGCAPGRLLGPPAQSYRIERRLSGGSWAAVDEVPDDPLVRLFTWRDDQLASDDYEYRVIPVTPAGLEPAVPGAESCAIASWPLPVTGLAATYGPVGDPPVLTLRLAWTDPPNLPAGSKLRVYQPLVNPGALGAREPMDYSAPYTEIEPGVEELVLAPITWGPGTLGYGLRVYDGVNEEQNTDRVVYISADADDLDVSCAPAEAGQVEILPTAAGELTVRGIVDHDLGEAAAKYVRLYGNGGAGAIDWVTPLASATLAKVHGQEGFDLVLAGLAEVTSYLFGLRTETAAGAKEYNVKEFSSAAVEETAPPPTVLTVAAAAAPPVAANVASILTPAPATAQDGLPDGRLATDAVPPVVQIGTRDPEAPDFRDMPGVLPGPVRWTLGVGSSVVLHVPRDLAMPQRGWYAARTAHPDREAGFIPSPAQEGLRRIRRGALVRVTQRMRIGHEPIEVNLFQGVVVGWTWDHAQEQMTVLCTDYCWFAAGIVLRGKCYAQPAPKFVLNAELIFNRQGRPDCVLGDPAVWGLEDHPQSYYFRFGPPDWKRLNEAVLGTGLGPAPALTPAVDEVLPDEAAGYWTPGAALAYLRDLHSREYQTVVPLIHTLNTWTPIVEWDPPTPDDLPALFRVADPVAGSPVLDGKPVQGMLDYEAHGGSLLSAWDEIPKRAGNLAFLLSPPQVLDENGRLDQTAKPRLTFLDLERPLTLVTRNPILGQLEAKLSEHPPEIEDADLTAEYAAWANAVIAQGARRRLQVTFYTSKVPGADDGLGQLKRHWTTELEIERAALDDEEQNTTRFRDVGLAYVIRPDCDLRAYLIDPREFTSSAAKLVDPADLETIGEFLPLTREVLQRLLSSYFSTRTGQEREKDLPLIERWDPESESWLPLPDGIGVQPLEGAFGFRLGPRARKEDDEYEDGTLGPYTYDPSKSPGAAGRYYDLRVTLALETDDLLTEEIENRRDGDAGEPRREFYCRDEKLLLEYIRAGLVRGDGLLGVGAETWREFRGTEHPVLLTDDRDHLVALAQKKLAELQRRKAALGTLSLPGIRLAYQPGMRIAALVPLPRRSTGEPDGLSRQAYPIEAIIRQVVWDFARQTTTLVLAAGGVSEWGSEGL